MHAGDFEVPYGSIVPRKTEVQNLIVPVCIATSHLGYGAYRLESPYMVVGHSSGVAAAMAATNNIAVQDVSVPALQRMLRAQGQVLTLAERKPVGPSPSPPPPLSPLTVGLCSSGDSAMAFKHIEFNNANVSLLLNSKGECASAIGYGT